MNPKNNDGCSDDLPIGDDYSEFTDGELEELAFVLIQALTILPLSTCSRPVVAESTPQLPSE
ncbi:hypothetical protein [Neorhizobium galegae]|uniref:hypothetical protein n=1 Tax=Neorhizobium galegae TaxID=399 RepID=UPI000A632304|nr:hypothetical protein [Neorhizobium galegae]KAB1122824.1 hypothetical protein F4V90_19200 [Neorhizobium galegae]MCQ1570195.1 hypothetical protein [Neorhizobium galegae]MCQ1807729.1 hypothetical protein [Neorhizobium galegae]MCQ1838299.1 hypothetical protein [Neorhizobium galegae]